MKKFYSEICYVLGILLLGLGSSMMTKADFGLSMVVAPAYILHLKMSEFWSFFSFGMAEYVFQAFLLVLVIVAVENLSCLICCRLSPPLFTALCLTEASR